jgi:hypothetical protein
MKAAVTVFLFLVVGDCGPSDAGHGVAPTSSWLADHPAQQSRRLTSIGGSPSANVSSLTGG